MPTYSQPEARWAVSAIFFQFHLEKRWGIDVPTTPDLKNGCIGKITIELVFSANRESYMLCRLAQQLSDLEWTFH